MDTIKKQRTLVEDEIRHPRIKTRAPMTGKNIWRPCKVYGRLIGRRFATRGCHLIAPRRG